MESRISCSNKAADLRANIAMCKIGRSHSVKKSSISALGRRLVDMESDARRDRLGNLLVHEDEEMEYSRGDKGRSISRYRSSERSQLGNSSRMSRIDMRF